MTNRQRIDSAREARLWLSQILVPLTTTVVTAMTIPEVRYAVIDKYRDLKSSIKNKINKETKRGV